MKPIDDSKPLFLQIRENIEDEIIDQHLKAGDQAPSTNQLVAYYKINPATVAKGINMLVDEGILYKKRGVGMFVAKGAREQLMTKRKQVFKEDYVWSMMQEARKLGISTSEIQEMIESLKGREV